MQLTRTTGILAVLAGATFGSLAGFFVRHIESAEGWQILFYRSCAFSLTVLLFMVITGKRNVFARFTGLGLPGLIVAICLGGAFIAYIFALLLTSVANAVFILSASPFIAGLLAWLWLGERLSLISWACMAVALAGVAVMMADGLLQGTILGSAVATIAALGYAASVVAFRAGKDIDMMPATCLAGVFAAIISAVLVDDFALSANDLTFALLLGSVQIGFQYILVTIAARAVPAGEVTLLMMLEVVAAPIWVWLAFGETPALLTLAGGILVLAAVGVQALSGLRRKSDPSPV